MRRYRAFRATRHSVDMDDEAMDDTITVYDEDEWVDTGLLDASGAPLYRSDRGPVGYVKTPRNQ